MHESKGWQRAESKTRLRHLVVHYLYVVRRLSLATTRAESRQSDRRGLVGLASISSQYGNGLSGRPVVDGSAPGVTLPLGGLAYIVGHGGVGYHTCGPGGLTPYLHLVWNNTSGQDGNWLGCEPSRDKRIAVSLQYPSYHPGCYKSWVVQLCGSSSHTALLRWTRGQMVRGKPAQRLFNLVPCYYPLGVAASERNGFPLLLRCGQYLG